MAQKTGALIFDETADRYDIRFDRMEYGDNWYLVGIRAEDLNGLRVRI